MRAAPLRRSFSLEVASSFRGDCHRTGVMMAQADRGCQRLDAARSSFHSTKGTGVVDEGGHVGEVADHVATAFALLVAALPGIGEVNSAPVVCGEGLEGQHLLFGIAHRGGAFRRPHALEVGG